MSYYKIAVLGDLHIPFIDKKAWGVTLKFLREIKPEKIVLIGDILDIGILSKFRKNPETITNLQDELDACHAELAQIRYGFPNSDIIYLFGNHEVRLRNYIWDKAQELSSLRTVSLEAELGLKDLDIKYMVNPNDYYKEGVLLLTHGTYVSQESAMTAKRMLKSYGVSIIHGHSHRLGSTYKTDCSGTKGAWENGCLCDLTLIQQWDMKQPADWQQGFSLVFMRNDKKLFHVDQIYIHEGEFIWGGKEYNDEKKT